MLVTCWVSLLFSEAPLDEVLMWSLSSPQTEKISHKSMPSTKIPFSVTMHGGECRAIESDLCEHLVISDKNSELKRDPLDPSLFVLCERSNCTAFNFKESLTL